MPKEKMKETELAQKFVEYLSDFELYYEVAVLGNVIDIVAVKKPLMIAVEVKTSFGLAVMEQAQRNTNYFNHSYIAVPYAKNGKFARRMCEKMGIGVLEWNGGRVIETIRPAINRSAFKRAVHLHEFQQRSIPGCVHGRNTPFKEMIKEITEYLYRHNGASFNEVFEHTAITYRTLSAFKSAMYQWTKTNVINEFYVDNGKLWLGNKNISTELSK